MRSTILHLAMALAAVSAAAVPVRAPAPAEGACPAIDPPAVAAPPAVRASIDPATGRLRPPTAEERRKLAAAARDRSARNYPVVVLPDGTKLVELDDAFLMGVVATKQPDGSLSYRCRTTAAAGPR